jgi:hypothetical protein
VTYHHHQLKVQKHGVQTQLFIYEGNQLHVSAKIYSHHQADLESKKENLAAVWV